MNRLHLVHYCHPDCEPLQNILRLPEREAFDLLTMAELRSRIAAHPEGTDGFLRDTRQQHHYIEAQLWDDAPCRYIERIR